MFGFFGVFGVGRVFEVFGVFGVVGGFESQGPLESVEFVESLACSIVWSV